MLFSVEQAFVGRDEKRAPLKTPAWEATLGRQRCQMPEICPGVGRGMLKLRFDRYIRLMYSCRLTSSIQFGLADKSLQMHPLFSQWHVKKDLNTEYSIMWERPLGYWCRSFQEFLSADCPSLSALRTPAMWRWKNLRQTTTVVSKGRKKLVKVENKHTFHQELVKT